VGVFANQPNPYAAKAHGMWGHFGWMLLGMIALLIGFRLISGNNEVFSQNYTFRKGQGESSFVTEPFDLAGRTSNVELSIQTDVSNNWAYFNFALINETTGKAFDFGREVSYYTDSEGSEGSRHDSVIVPSVPPGRYYLRVEPETPDSTYPLFYHLELRRDVPVYSFFFLAIFLLLIPPIFAHWRSMSFEGRRWMESDYVSVSSSGGGDD
jgi:hypothetical protein